MYEAFVINLPERRDRWLTIQSHIAEKSKLLKLVQFAAFEGRPGWRFCALSHLALIRKAQMEGRQYIIVMEDDNMIISPSQPTTSNEETDFDKVFGSLMEKLLEQIEDWDLFNGNPSWCSKKPNQKITSIGTSSLSSSNMQIVQYEFGQCANFVIYNNSCFEKVLSLEPRYTSLGTEIPNSPGNYDAYAYDQLLCKLDLRLATHLPYLFSQRSGWSDIMTQETNYQRGIFEKGETVLKTALAKQTHQPQRNIATNPPHLLK